MDQKDAETSAAGVTGDSEAFSALESTPKDSSEYHVDGKASSSMVKSLETTPALRNRRVSFAASPTKPPRSNIVHRHRYYATDVLRTSIARVTHLFFRAIWLVFKFLFIVITNYFFIILHTLIIFGVVSAFAAAILYFAQGDYFSVKQATLAVPSLLVNTALNTSSTLLMYSYCRFPLSPRWGCPRPQLFPDKVIGGMIIQVSRARDIFEMITELGRTESTCFGQNYLQYFLSYELLTFRIFQIADQIEITETLEHKDILTAAFRRLDEQTTKFVDGIGTLKATGMNIASFIVYEVFPQVHESRS